jgi:hypothetical protein
MQSDHLPRLIVPFPLANSSGGTVREYDVVLQGDDGQIYQQRYQCPWSTEKDFVTLESIARACAASAFVNEGKKQRYAGISATLV